MNSPFFSDSVISKVDIKAELLSRPSRPPNYEAENQALLQLSNELAERPNNMLQKLVNIALDLCQAGSAGISLLEIQQGIPVFRWHALVGAYKVHLNGTMRRDMSPCGVTVERNSTQLMAMPERVFPMQSDPRVYEALLVPFHLRTEPIGTVWVVSHDEQRKFDREDERIIKSLAAYASAGWLVWRTLQQNLVQGRKKEAELTVVNEVLQSEFDKLMGTCSP